MTPEEAAAADDAAADEAGEETHGSDEADAAPQETVLDASPITEEAEIDQV